MLYASLKPVARVALAWYYRSITVSGAGNLPASGPVFLAVNHPNALVDALVVAACFERRVRFTAKATIFANPVVAVFLRRAGVVPLRRASDERAASETPDAAAAAAGKTADPAADQTADAAGGATAIVTTVAGVSVNGTQYPVLDTAPVFEKGTPTPTPDPTSTSTPDPSRNSASFDAVADALAEGAAIVIFPEGKSHDAPQLAPLRTGLARMVGMARDERGVRGIRIVPIGLLFERKEEPRTRVLVQVGEPIDVDTFQGGTATVAMLTDAVSKRLAAVTSNFDNTDDAERIGMIGETLGALLEPVREISDDVVPLSATLALVRRIDRTQRALREPAQELRHPGVSGRITTFEGRLRAFRARLAAERVDVHDVAISTGVAPGAQFAVREAAIALLLLPVVAWGRLTHWAPLRLARAIATRNTRALDEPAMRTLVIGLLLVLVSYAIETAAIGFIAGPWWALAFFASLVPSATADFRYADRLHRARARARAYFLFRRTPALQRELLAEAEWLRDEAGTLERLAIAA